MQKKNNGFVLFVVMIYLQCFALLALSALTSDVLMLKTLQVKNQHLTQQQQVLQILNNLHFKSATSCLKPINSPAFLLKQSLHFWQAAACFGKHHSNIYYYYQSELEVDRCAVIKAGAERGQAVSYYVQTLAYDHAAVIVQEIIALPSSLSPLCDKPLREISPGRQRLRWLR